MIYPSFQPPTRPGQFHVVGAVYDNHGKMQGRQATALIYAPNALAAAQAPIIDLMRERLEAGLNSGMYYIEIKVKPVRGEGATNG